MAVNGGPEQSGESATEKIPPREILKDLAEQLAEDRSFTLRARPKAKGLLSHGVRVKRRGKSSPVHQ